MNGNAANRIFGDEDGRARVKICGITNEADAAAAIQAGADALGVNFYRQSPRHVDLSVANEWLSRLPGDILRIAVLVNPTIEEALALAAMPFIDALQLHGDESPEFCRMLAERGFQFMKAIRVRDDASLGRMPSYSTPTILLDSYTPGFGGSGQVFPWHLAARLVETRPDLQIVIAGGLTPENVIDAIRQVHPTAVDVTSGVESAPGRKDSAKLKAFVDAARAAMK